MNKKEVLDIVQNIFHEVTENPNIKLTSETTSEHVEEWDSLTHIQLVVAVEEKFEISFTSEEIGSYANVGEMCDGIIAKKS